MESVIVGMVLLCIELIDLDGWVVCWFDLCVVLCVGDNCVVVLVVLFVLCCWWLVG